MHAICIELIH